MSHPDPTYREASSVPERVVYYALQPAAIILSLSFWWSNPDNPLSFAIILVTLHVVLGTLERVMPARPGWLISGRQMALNVFIVLVLTVAMIISAMVTAFVMQLWNQESG